MGVAKAINKGLDSPNQIIVVDIKGKEVAAATAKRMGCRFAYQENLALSKFDASARERDV